MKGKRKKKTKTKKQTAESEPINNAQGIKKNVTLGSSFACTAIYTNTVCAQQKYGEGSATVRWLQRLVPMRDKKNSKARIRAEAGREPLRPHGTAY